MRTHIIAVMILSVLVACGGPSRSSESPSLEPAPPPESSRPSEASPPSVRIELAWVIADVAVELDLVGCKLVLRVIDHDGKDKLHEVGKWWRVQKAMVEVVEPATEGPVLFRTEAMVGQDGELTSEPRFEVLQDRDAAVVIVRGRDRDTPWQELTRVSVPAGMLVQPQASPR